MVHTDTDYDTLTKEIKIKFSEVKEVLIIGTLNGKEEIYLLSKDERENLKIEGKKIFELLDASGNDKDNMHEKDIDTHYDSDFEKPDEISLLTQREIEIIRLIANGYSSKEIAEKLFISKFTVETHRKNILSKLNIKRTALLVKFAIENKID